LKRWLTIPVICIVSSCAPHVVPPPPVVPVAPGPPQALRIQLSWSAPADLDLYVTDPSFETVYFANTPTRSGGRLVRDVRCGTIDPVQPSLELVAWDAAPAGRYRVGVDFIESCSRSSDPVSFRASVELGDSRREVTGTVEPERFQPIVMEFVVRGAADGSPPALEVQP
jgi:hypothetical protein